MNDYDPEAHLLELAARMGYQVRFGYLPAKLVGLTDFVGKTVTICDRSLPREQRSTMAHEAVHLERGAVPRWATPREERAVERVAARRLIDLEELIEAVRWTDSIEELAETLGVDNLSVVERIRGLTPEEGARFDRALPPERRRRGLRKVSMEGSGA